MRRHFQPSAPAEPSKSDETRCDQTAFTQERTALMTQTFPTLYQAIEPMLRLARFGLCRYKAPEPPAGTPDGGQQFCLAEATVCDLRSRQEMCLAHFELVRPS